MNQTTLLVFAHPDDETFSCGGSIAQWAKDPGHHIILYCATRGEAGKRGDPPLCSPEKLGEVRTEELQRAADILGIDQVVMRDFPDGKLTDLPLNLLVEDLQKIISNYTPQTVITFPPHGISGHPDHKAIHLATVEAIRTGSVETKLLYSVIPDSMARHFTQPIYSTPDKDVSLEIDVSKERKTIMKALQQHRTQHLSIERVFPGVMDGKWDRIRNVEYFQEVTLP